MLELARTQLRMDVAWLSQLSQLSGTEVTFSDVVAGTSSLGPAPGSHQPLLPETSATGQRVQER